MAQSELSTPKISETQPLRGAFASVGPGIVSQPGGAGWVPLSWNMGLLFSKGQVIRYEDSVLSLFPRLLSSVEWSRDGYFGDTSHVADWYAWTPFCWSVDGTVGGAGFPHDPFPSVATVSATSVRILGIWCLFLCGVNGFILGHCRRSSRRSPATRDGLAFSHPRNNTEVVSKLLNISTEQYGVFSQTPLLFTWTVNCKVPLGVVFFF